MLAVAGYHSRVAPVESSVYVRCRLIVAISSRSTCVEGASPERFASVSESVSVKSCPAWDTPMMMVPSPGNLGYGS